VQETTEAKDKEAQIADFLKEWFQKQCVLAILNGPAFALEQHCDQGQTKTRLEFESAGHAYSRSRLI